MPNPKRPDISSWYPNSWDGFVGNEQLLKYMQNVVKQLLPLIEQGAEQFGNLPRIFISGASRSGKTSIVHHTVRCLCCEQFDFATGNPCQKTCDWCKDRGNRYGVDGFFTEFSAKKFNPKRALVHYMPVNCSQILSPSDLMDKIHTIRGADNYQGLTIVYLDEVHPLVKRGMDEQLLKDIEQDEILWIMSTACIEKLSPMLLARMVQKKTALPSKDSLALWLCSRCKEWGIPYEDKAIAMITRLSDRSPGVALTALSEVATNLPEGLTTELAENWIVPTF